MIELEGYRVEKRLDGTAQSDVYAAVASDDGAHVVVKVYKRPCASLEASRANRELHLLRELSRARGVPRAVEVALVDHHPAIVIERCEGVALASYIADRPQRGADVSAFLEIGTQLARTLGDVHEAKVVHKDLNPQNILVDPVTLETTLIDFGVASKLGRAQTHHDAPTEGGGSWVYAAPEQSGRIDRGIDFRTDLYSLGAVLYALLTGGPPFCSEDPLELILAHLTRLPPPPVSLDPGIPEVLSKLVLKLLSKDPDQRYQRALGVHHDLSRCAELWERDGAIPSDFVLAQRDGPLRVCFPSEPVGREREQQQLRDALARVSEGTPEVVFLRGPSGIGKSTLVGTLRSAVHAFGGHVIWVKYDLGGSKRPYEAISRALERWVSQVLISSEEHLVAWRAELEEALGNLAPVLPDLAPDFRLLLQETEPAPRVDPDRTRDRLAVTFERLVRGLATPAHPLVLVLDDVQWIDAESLALVRRLARKDTRAALLLVCTHRGRDTPRALRGLLDDIRDAEIDLGQMALAPLSAQDSATWIAAALGRDPSSVRTLVEVLGRKTDNNPFLIQRFVESLVDSGHIRFEGEIGWTWSDEALHTAEIPDDVAGLIAQRVAGLPPEVKRVLTFAACIGDEFELDVLARLSRDPRPAIELALYALGDKGLISPSPAGFRFAHDRVREAANALLTEHERAHLHSDIAHLLLERTSDEDLDEQLFTIVEHFGRSVELVDPELRIRVLDVHLLAASRALGEGAAEAAMRYLAVARELHHESDWDDASSRSFRLWLASAQAARHANDNDAALAFVNALLERPLDETQRGQVGHLRIVAEEQCSTERGMEVALEELARTGVRWPTRPSLLQTWRAVIRAEWRLWLRRSDDLLRPPRRRIPDRLVARLLLLGSASTTFTSMNSRLACFAAAEAVWVMAKYGAVAQPTYALAGLGGQRFTVTRNPRMSLHLAAGAREAIRTATAPASAFGSMPYRGPYILAMLIDVWTEPRMKALAPLPALVRQALEAGDHPWAMTAAYRYAFYQALSGIAVDICLESLHDFCREFGATGTFQQDVVLSTRLVEVLKSGESVASVCPLSSERAPARAIWAGIQQSTLAMQVACVMGEFEWAFDESDLVADAPLECPHTAYVVDYCLFRGLAAAAVATHPLHRRRARRIVGRMHGWLRACARYGCDFVGPARFLAAERARLARRHDRALELYDACQRASEDSGYVHHAALAFEREASLLRAVGRADLARSRIARSLALYERWGADAKVAALAGGRVTFA